MLRIRAFGTKIRIARRLFDFCLCSGERCGAVTEKKICWYNDDIRPAVATLKNSSVHEIHCQLAMSGWYGSRSY